MIREIKKYPEAVLRKKAEEIKEITPEIKERYLKAIARNIYDRLGGYQSNEIVKIN